MNPIIKEITAHQVKSDITPFKVGDGVRVHTKVREGDKERVQVYSGIVIARKGSGIHESFTVRRISYGEGVERVFPLHSNRIDKVEVERQGSVRRAKLTYLRDRIGKSALAVREKVGIMDLSTFSKYDVKGKDAHGFLDRICANRIPSKEGGIILGHLLNANGFIESEITVTRLGPEHYYVLSAAVAQLHDLDQMNWRKRPEEKVTVTDAPAVEGAGSGPLELFGAMPLCLVDDEVFALGGRREITRKRKNQQAEKLRTSSDI